MDGGTIERIKRMINERDHDYFASRGLADLLDEAGIEHDRGAILALVRRLIDDDVYGFFSAISVGLRDAASDDDEFAGAVSAVAGAIRHDAMQWPFVDVLIETGRAQPGAAAGIAARLIGTGDADFAAYLIGGAYGGAESECGGMVERLLSSGEPWGAASALRALRIANKEHGIPDAERIREKVWRAMDYDDAPACQEAMEAMISLHKGGDKAAAGMIESMAARYRECRFTLAGRISCESLFDDEQSLRHLETCMGGDPRQGTIYSIYCALANMAGREPLGTARLLFMIFGIGRYHSALAGNVLEELGRKDAPGVVLAILDMLQGPRHPALDGRLGTIMHRLVRFADLEEVAGRVFRAMGERPALLGPCLSILDLLVVEGRQRGSRPDFAESVLSRLRGHPACAGIGEDGPRRDASPECARLLRRIREHAAPQDGSLPPPMPSGPQGP